MKIKIFLLLGALLVIISCKKDVALPTPPPPVVKAPQATPIAVPNGDFENWDSQLRPLSWYTNGCPLCQGAPFDEYVVRKDTNNVYHGNFSAQFYYNWNFQPYAKNRFPITLHPSYLQAYIKDTMLTAADSVLIKVDLFYQKHHVDSGMWMGENSIPAYSLLQIPITQNSANADSVIITIRGQCYGRPYSSCLWVDDLSLFK